MQSLEISTTANKVLISIDRKKANKEFLLNLLNSLRIEYLAEKVDFDESIEKLGEEIKKEWWKENKKKYLNGK